MVLIVSIPVVRLSRNRSWGTALSSEGGSTKCMRGVMNSADTLEGSAEVLPPANTRLLGLTPFSRKCARRTPCRADAFEQGPSLSPP